MQHANAGAQRAFLFLRQTRAVSEKEIVFWALGRVTAPHAHLTARPTHMASTDSLRTTAVEHGAHAATAAAAATATATAAAAAATAAAASAAALVARA